MTNEKKKIVFTVYPSVYESFKETCDSRGISITEQIELLTTEYLSGKLGNIESLRNSLSSVKKGQEKKSGQATIRINPELYSRLVENLQKHNNTRPASFFNLVMAHLIANTPVQLNFAKKAEFLLASSPKEITHIVYGLKYYKPSKEINQPYEHVHTEYFLDACTEEQFSTIYAPQTPLLFVLAVHRNIF